MLNPADPGFVAKLATLLPEGTVRPVEPGFLEEPRGRMAGIGGALVVPANTEQVAVVIRACAADRVGVIPYGGGTGLVGGQVMPVAAVGATPLPIILSLQRMTAIRAVYPSENVLIAEAGAVLADVQAVAARIERLFALSLASEGTARIGGNLATNAGGVNVLRYGNARDLCLGLEVVMADGSIWHGLKRLRKDNTGYDLRHLLIGSEGTLGVITAASLQLHPVPAATGTALMVVASPAAALDLLALAQGRFGEGISAFELIHRTGLEFLTETMPDLRQPFASAPEWMVLIDLGLAAALHPKVALEALFAAAEGRALVSDGLIAQSQAQRAAFWAVREAIPLANRKIGAIASHDIALPLGNIADFIPQAGQALARIGEFRINCFGHLGDGNLHYNVFPPRGVTRDAYAGQAKAIKTCVHDLVDAMAGSVSAEHGLGRLKVEDLERYGDPAKLAAMRAIKAALDPVGILNPGAVLRAR